MKVWQKNFIYTLILFTTLFFICIYIVDTMSFSTALQSERETAIREESLLSKTLQNDILNIETRDNYINGVASRVASFAATYQKKGIFLAIWNKGNIIYSNCTVLYTPDSNSDSRTCNIIESNGDKFIFVHDTIYSSKINGYPFVYQKNITPMYNTLFNRSLILISIGVAIAQVFAFLLYLTLRSIYKPVNNLAHELRTPLTAIRGYAEYLQNAAASEDERYYAAQFIIEESKRLSNVCDRLLILANLREGDIVFEDLNIDSIFQNVRMTFKNVDFEIKKHSIKGDKTLIQSMINNFVSNAVKASPEDGLIHLKCYDNIIEVIDTGKGMDHAMLSHISKFNYRIDKSDSKKIGNGLGLPLCREIARFHNARLKFISEEGKGTTVRIFFTAS